MQGSAAFAAVSAASGRIAAIRGDGREILLQGGAVSDLAKSLSGELLLPGSRDYDSARRVWNGMVDKRPALIAVCANAKDVANSVSFASSHDLLLAVKGGGHSYPGKSVCDGGLMIDLAPMNDVQVDAGNRTAEIGGGALLGHLDSATLRENLATTTGIVSHTGVGGFTLGGGMGRIDRKFGLAIDNLLAAEIVTADGRIHHVDTDENPELFWAIRGGGGNFGVVTRFRYRLHPFDPMVFGGDIYYPFSQARDLLTFYAEYSASIPDELNIEPIGTLTGEGDRVLYFSVTYAGDHRQAEKVLAPLRSFGRPGVDNIRPLPYRELQTQADDYYAHGTLNYLKSGYFSELTPATIDAIVDSYEGEMLPDIWFQHLGGATARVRSDATAFFHRGVHSNFGISAVWQDDSESAERIEAIRRIYAAIEPHTTGFYTNLHEDTERRTWGNYGANYERLVQIKNRYDPTNLFRLNANIKPTIGDPASVT
jgi:FAD/FMN-containing dehydrogenase